MKDLKYAKYLLNRIFKPLKDKKMKKKIYLLSLLLMGIFALKSQAYEKL